MTTDTKEVKAGTPPEPKVIKKLNNASSVDLIALKEHLEATKQTLSVRYSQVEKLLRVKLLCK